MKGLLLKDWYMMKKYCKIYLLIVLIFIAVSFSSDGNLFFVLYPCFLCGMIPVNLLAYDDRSRWTQYSGALPYTKTQIVSSKYIIGLLAEAFVIGVTGIAQAIGMSVNGTFRGHDFAVLIMMLFISAVIFPAVCLPFIFKFGVEKGRTAYYVMLGFVCAVAFLLAGVSKDSLNVEIQPNMFLLSLCLVVIIGYAVSWYLSIVFYKKRDV